MPYIPKKDRQDLWFCKTPEVPGQLNYMITTLLDEYLQEHGINYTTLNEVIGVLECTKCELYRRIVVPYETKKLKENGDVYGCILNKDR